MKMKVDTAVLQKALFRVQGVADKKSTMPILAHVLLDASKEKGLTVNATDLDVGLSGSYEAEIEEPGSVAVNARQLYDIVKALPTPKVEFHRDDNHWVEIKSGSSRFRLVGMPADEFPALPSHAQIKTFEVSADELAEMIDRTIFCVSTDDNRHNLGGIYCEASDAKTLRMVATDGHRLAMQEKSFKSDVKVDRGVIVPRKGFQELKRILSDSEENISTVELGFSNNNGLLKAGNVVLSTRLVEGQFPDYEQVIPAESNRTVRIRRQGLIEALRRVSLLSQGRAYGVRLSISRDALELQAEDPELGEAQETLEVEYSSEPLSIGFNARYLLDVLTLIHDEGVMLELTDDLSPGIIKPIEEKGYLAVVMPMRI